MRSSSKQSGFTLVEMIVSLGLFSIVVTVAVGALLVLIATNEQLQAEQSVMTNLSFALDSMTREIRTGTHFFCATAMSANNNVFANGKDLDDTSNATKVIDPYETNDCSLGNYPTAGNRYHGLVFREGGESITGAGGGRILYFHDSDTGQIFRKVGGQDAQSIVSSGIFITSVEFYVTGSRTLSDFVPPLNAPGTNPRLEQPAVTIIVEAIDKENSTSAKDPYRIQTTVTQRTLDI